MKYRKNFFFSPDLSKFFIRNFFLELRFDIEVAIANSQIFCFIEIFCDFDRKINTDIPHLAMGPSDCSHCLRCFSVFGIPSIFTVGSI